MKQIKGLIFDVDGVIINTENAHFLAFKKVLKKYGFNLSKESYKKHFSGRSIKGGILSLLEEVDLKHDSPLNDFVTQFSKEKIEATIGLFKKNLNFFKDTLKFINKILSGERELKKIGYLPKKPVFALSTGLESVLLNEVLKHYDLKNIFPITITAEQYTHSKPHPECYNLAVSQMKLLPEQVIGIEDSPSGILALNNAGIFSVGITTTHTKKDLKEANLVVKKLTNLLL